MENDKIYLGDAYELIKQVPDDSVDLIVTDPPYQFIKGGGGGAFGSKNKKYHSEYMKVGARYKRTIDNFNNGLSSEITLRKTRNESQFGGFETGIDLSILDEFCRIMKRINLYIWCNKEQIFDYLKYFIDGKGCNFEIITWHKANPIPTTNNTYLPDTEYCLFFRDKGVKLIGDYSTKSKYYLTNTNKGDKDDYFHPTIKPLDIIENLVANSSDEGDLVFDPFMGSGTTAVAAKELGWHFLGFEINEKFHTIAEQRLKGITQKQAASGWVQEKLF